MVKCKLTNSGKAVLIANALIDNAEQIINMANDEMMDEFIGLIKLILDKIDVIENNNKEKALSS